MTRKVSKLLNTAFKAKKGTLAYEFFGEKPIYISEINDMGELALTSLSPKDRDEQDWDFDEYDHGSAWHCEKELIYIKP